MKILTTEELSNLTSHQLLFKLDEIRNNAMQLGYEKAEAEKKLNDLKELMPTFLAQYQSKYFDAEERVTVSEARMRALADEGYKKKVEEMNQAEYEATLKDVEHRAWMKSLEALTAISYTRNNELKLAR